jgi:hypothetical protein
MMNPMARIPSVYILALVNALMLPGCHLLYSAADETVDAPPNVGIVFVTFASFPANLGGLAGADAKCMAAVAGLDIAKGRSFVALLQTSTVTMESRLTGNGGWQTPSGAPIARTKEDFVNGTTLNPLVENEKREPIPTEENFAWNGKDLLSGSANCADWTATTGKASLGLVRTTLPLQPASFDCTGNRPLICVSKDAIDTFVLPAPTEKRLFMTSVPYAADKTPNICNVEAMAAGVSGRFSILRYPFAALTAPKYSRRTDNIPVLFRLVDGVYEPSTFLNRTVNGNVIQPTEFGAAVSVWTGAMKTDCKGWSIADSDTRGEIGNAIFATRDAFSAKPLPCNQMAHFYCVED